MAERPVKKNRMKIVSKKTMSRDNLTDEAQDTMVADILQREIYKRDRALFNTRANLLSFTLNVLLIIAVIFLGSKEPQYRYFFMGSDGRLIEEVPLDRPFQSDDDIIQYVANTVAKTYTFDFVNFRNQFMEVRENYTNEGWANFEQSLVRDNILTIVRQNNLVTSAIPTGAPVISDRSVINGVAIMKIQFPMVISYSGERNFSDVKLTMTVTVQRVDPKINPRGIGIVSIIGS